jgi:hypothetical protein
VTNKEIRVWENPWVRLMTCHTAGSYTVGVIGAPLLGMNNTEQKQDLEHPSNGKKAL